MENAFQLSVVNPKLNRLQTNQTTQPILNSSKTKTKVIT